MTTADEPRVTIDAEGVACPAPIPEDQRVILGHGSGGQLSNALMRDVLAPALGAAAPGGPLNDAAVVDVPAGRLAFTTDSFVVSPIRFPGGNIGELAVNGTLNDLAMMGAQPLAISLAYVIEEGLPLEELRLITVSAAEAAARAGAKIVTGDTKVVGRGAADRLFVNTAGIGIVPEGVAPAADRARPGDAVILSGPIGLHGVAIMSVREGLEFEVEIASDTQALNALGRGHRRRRAGYPRAARPDARRAVVGAQRDRRRFGRGHGARRARHPDPGARSRGVRVPGPRPPPRGQRGQAGGDRAGVVG